MTINQIKKYIKKYHCGDTINVNNPASPDKVLERVNITQIFTNYVIVSNGKYNWCVDWIEVMKKNFGE